MRERGKMELKNKEQSRIPGHVPGGRVIWVGCKKERKSEWGPLRACWLFGRGRGRFPIQMQCRKERKKKKGKRKRCRDM